MYMEEGDCQGEDDKLSQEVEVVLLIHLEVGELHFNNPAYLLIFCLGSLSSRSFLCRFSFTNEKQADSLVLCINKNNEKMRQTHTAFACVLLFLWMLAPI